jgi:peptidoglycan L-alanyl-D-glutamate endopeptidase CwlK
VSRKIADLTEAAQYKYRLLAAASLMILGRELFLVETHRSHERQDELYLIGREPEDVRRTVTNAKGGESYHQFEVAFDVAFEEDGSQRPTWSTTTSQERADWELLGAMGKRLGLTWGGDFDGLKDFGHFHDAQGRSLQQLQADWERRRNE